jgi:hypothetical protein
MKTARLLGLVLAMQVGILASVLSGGRGGPAPAMAQIPDAGAQRAAVVDELKALNAKMDKLIDLLNSGNLQVKVATPDDKGK